MAPTPFSADLTVPAASFFVTPVAVPVESALRHFYASVNLADAYATALPEGAISDPESLARFIFSQQPAWIGALMKVRDAVVAVFGLKTARHLGSRGAGDPAGRVGIFKLYSTGPHEVVLGEDDKHLDFRVSVLCTAGTGPRAERRLVLSTVGHCHNLLGRIYILVIAPFHRLVVKSSLRRAARAGWPAAPG
jgi:hypothetical protein